MSYDDDSLGPRESGRQTDDAVSGAGPLSALLGTLRAVRDRFAAHLTEWPGRYVDQQASLYEHD